MQEPPKLYQMVCVGQYAFFDRAAKIYCRAVYSNRDNITQEVIDKFHKTCTEPMNDGDMWYLGEGAEVKIVELQLADGELVR